VERPKPSGTNSPKLSNADRPVVLSLFLIFSSNNMSMYAAPRGMYRKVFRCLYRRCPPLPIPNREVKPARADGIAVTGGRVGRCLILYGSPLSTDSGLSVFGDIGKAVSKPVSRQVRCMAAGGFDPPLRNGTFRRKLLPNDLGISSHPVPRAEPRGILVQPILPSLILITSSKHSFPSSSFPSLLSTLFDFSIRKINLKKPCYSLYGN